MAGGRPAPAPFASPAPAVVAEPEPTPEPAPVQMVSEPVPAPTPAPIEPSAPAVVAEPEPAPVQMVSEPVPAPAPAPPAPAVVAVVPMFPAPAPIVHPRPTAVKPERGLATLGLGCVAGGGIGITTELTGLFAYALPVARSSLTAGAALGTVAVAGCAVGVVLAPLFGK
ncbi:hypothetical protein WCLP8_5210001 [uncultured Gammaproteobacteria bacterium]